jgi:uncharacterized membrane protein YoaK (UPF0700 family)
VTLLEDSSTFIGGQMEHEGAEQDIHLPAVLLVLTMTTGLIDAVSVLGLGRVFTANMTGNIVFLGFALAAAPGFSASRSLAALGAFLVGAIVGGRLSVSLGSSRRRWLVVAATVEAAALLTAAVLALGSEHSAETLPSRIYALIGLTAVAMGVRNATVRKLAVPDLTTTVLTLTLTGLGADSGLAGGRNPRWRRRLSSVVAMLIGATVGALLVRNAKLAWPLALSGVLALGAAWWYAARPEGVGA